MIKLRHDFFFTLVILCLVTAEARYYPPQSILRGWNAELLDILLRGNGNPEISTVLSDGPKPILRIGNPPGAATQFHDPKPAVGYPKANIPIGNPAVATMLRDNPRAFLRGGDPEISAMLRHNPKPNLNSYDGSLKLLAMLREYPIPLLNNPGVLRVSKHSESDNHVLPSPVINKYTIKDNDLKETLNRMIETVAKVNDERIENLKNFFELENYLPQVSRTTEQKNPLIAFFMNTPNYKPKYDNLNINHLTEEPQYAIVEIQHNEPNMLNTLREITEGTYFQHSKDDGEVNISKESDEIPDIENYYLRGWNGCKKSAIKTCTKACKKAIKSVCDDFMCHKSFKKAAKKKCKTKCKSKFGGGDDDTDSDET